MCVYNGHTGAGSKLENVIIEGGGLLDANASDWYEIWASPKVARFSQPCTAIGADGALSPCSSCV